MKSNKSHSSCVCTQSNLKNISKIKNIFIKTFGKSLFLKTDEFHYISYNIYYYISMIFIYLTYYIYLPIFKFLIKSQLITTDHIGARDVSLFYIQNVTSDPFRSQLITLVQRLEMI